ncbi:sigma-70 family RNA polymerase sigma factor [Streptosporangium sp. V21-05]|uniref:sigma-70 family RNA polymerase sigma factor n=1 Tax=Streptosporangium sp. V21-05 TaxID=3446115 RepID=UPI003F52E249
MSGDAHRAVDAVWKMESARIVAGLVRMVGDVGLAEELAQDALLAALEQWPGAGVPDNPGAWLMAVAKRRAIDHLRREERLGLRHERLAHDLATRRDTAVAPGSAGSAEADVDAALDGEVGDDILRLMFVSCHPALPAESRVALTLRLLGGLRTEEIARAFLVPEPTVAQRVVRAKRTLASLRIPFEIPEGPDREARLSSVLGVVYLVFNEGYAASAGDDLMRQDLCQEALRLGRLLAGLAPGEAEAHGLVALMELQASRSAARTGASGEPVALHEQNRGRWDRLLIRRGFTALLRARQCAAPFGPYVLQAAIAACHARARTAEETDWTQITALYEALARVLPTPVVQLNRAVALAMARGPEAGLALVDTLVGEPVFKGYHRLPSVRGDLLARLGRHEEARREFERAAALTLNGPERAILTERAAACADITARRTGGPGTGTPGKAVPGRDTPGTAVTLAEAATAFLARDDLDAATVRSYRQTMNRLRRDLGDDIPLPDVTAARVAEIFGAAWGDAAPATWNRHRGAVRSFSAWAAAEGPLTAGQGSSVADAGPSIAQGPPTAHGSSTAQGLPPAHGPSSAQGSSTAQRACPAAQGPSSAQGLSTAGREVPVAGQGAPGGGPGGGVPRDLAAGLGRRPEPRGRTRPMDRPRVEALWERPDIAPRERALWLLLHESAAGAGPVLSLNVEDLDLAGRRGKVATGSGWVHWRSGTAELLPYLVAGRRRGPLFLSDRRPGPGRPPAPGDLCPETGRRRLSYERAEYLFKRATGHTLDQLRAR